MKVLLITTHLEYGGISSYTVALAKTLAARGHTVWCASSSGTMVAQLKKNGIEHIRIPIRTKSELNPFLLLCAAQLCRIIQQESIDIMHAQTRVAQVVANVVSRITKVPFISTCHGFFRPNIGRRFFSCWGEKVIAISDAVAGHLTDDFSVARDSIVLIPNGIDVGQFRVSPKRTDPHLLCRKVGIIARLSPVKGHRYLIEAMAKVVKEFPDALLYIFGEGKIKYELVKRVEKLNISEKVLFLPAVSHSAEVLQEIDIFVMPSLQEGLGLSLLEAQACGLPVIASNVGGIPTIVQHNTTGLLVPPQDVEALAEAIARVMANKNLAMMLGRQGRRAVEEKFNVQIMTEKVEAVYAKVLNHE